MIKNIFFDIGNVLIKIHTEVCIQYWADSADLEKKEIRTAFSDDLHNAYEIGQLNDDQFYNGFKDLLPQSCCLKKSDFWKGWNKILGNESSMVKVLKSISKDYNTWILSNTNPRHINDLLEKTYTFFEDINGSIYSFNVGVRKPDPLIFKKALKIAGSLPRESLFIDDLIENVESAKKLGFKVIHYNESLNLKNELELLGINKNYDCK